MTIHELSGQLYDLSVNGMFNGEHWTKRQLESYIANLFRPELQPLAVKDRILMQIALPDGEWLFSVDHYADGRDCFDYTLPDTREQESRLFDLWRQ